MPPRLPFFVVAQHFQFQAISGIVRIVTPILVGTRRHFKLRVGFGGDQGGIPNCLMAVGDRALFIEVIGIFFNAQIKMAARSGTPEIRGSPSF